MVAYLFLGGFWYEVKGDLLPKQFSDVKFNPLPNTPLE